MDIDNNTARLINEVANYALTRSELPRVTRERDALLKACKMIDSAWRDGLSVHPTSLCADTVRAAIAMCEQQNGTETKH